MCFRVPVSGSSPSNHPHKSADSAASAQEEVLHLKQTYGGSQKHFVCRRSGGPFWLVDFICFLSRWNRLELSDQIKVQIWRLCSHEEHHICHQSFDKRINQPLYPHPSHFSFPLPPLFLSLLPFFNSFLSFLWFHVSPSLLLRVRRGASLKCVKRQKFD